MAIGNRLRANHFIIIAKVIVVCILNTCHIWNLFICIEYENEVIINATSYIFVENEDNWLKTGDVSSSFHQIFQKYGLIYKIHRVSKANWWTLKA